MLKESASSVLATREANLVRRKEPMAYGLWQETELELPKIRIDSSSRQTTLFLSHQPSAISYTLFSPASGHDTILNSGETRIRPIPHLAANRQQPDDPSGGEPTHSEHTGRLRVAPAVRAFTNHWKRGPYSSLFGLSSFSG